jgi:hypothetical protein
MAAAFSATVIVNRNDLPRIAAQGRRKANQAVRRCGLAVQRYAAPYTPVLTGNLKANVMLFMTSDVSAELKWMMFYAIFQNDGTSRGVPAKQFREHGMAMAMPGFERDMAGVYGGVY